MNRTELLQAYETIFQSFVQNGTVEDYLNQVDETRDPYYQVTLNGRVDCSALLSYWMGRNAHLKVVKLAYEGETTVVTFVPAAEMPSGMRIQSILKKALIQDNYEGTTTADMLQNVRREAEKELGLGLVEVKKKMAISLSKLSGMFAGKKKAAVAK